MEPVKLKAVLSAVLIASGALMTVMIGTGSPTSVFQSQGLAIDFGGRDVVWTSADLHLFSDPIDLLTAVSDENGLVCEITDGVVRKITRTTPDGERIYGSDQERGWDLWVIEKGKREWTKIIPPYNIRLIDQTSCAWAYCGGSETPSVGADQAGNSIFGYARPWRTVSLAPAITEMIGALNASSVLVGADSYSNYPHSVGQAKMRGDITTVGGYVNPSYEMIMSTDPDMVYCDGSQYVHHDVSDRLRRANVPTVILYSGESIGTILDNIYIIGMTLKYDQTARNVIEKLSGTQEYLNTLLTSGGADTVRTMFALSPDKAPWVAGRQTYIDDITLTVLGENAIPDNFYGWVHASSEIIASVAPSVMIIISERYVADRSEYLEMLDGLSAEWRSAPAYNSGDPAASRIYLLCGDLAEMASRPGPRCVQLMELIAMILHPEVFGQELPRYIGNEYASYLNITKLFGFDN